MQPGEAILCTILSLTTPLDQQSPPAAAGSPAALESSPPTEEEARATPPPVSADAEAFAGFFKDIKVTGFVDSYYGYNWNRPPSGQHQLRNFDSQDDQFSLNLAELALEQTPSSERRVGFRIDADFGPATHTVHSLDEGGPVVEHLQQAYVSYLAPVGKGLQLELGKFVTPAGAEVIESTGNWNYSRSLLFALAIPYYHFGLRATYPVTEKVTLAGYLVNGWNNTVDNNDQRTVCGQAVWKPSAAWSLVQNYIGGPEQPGGADWRHLWDTVVTYTPRPWLSLMVNYDNGRDSSPGAAGRWQGLAAYARVRPRPGWYLAPRWEWYQDRQGVTTGAGQTVRELTLTSEHMVSGDLLARIELRRDASDAAVFARSGDRSGKSQTTLTVGVVYAFGSTP